MPIVRIRERGQVTIPLEYRKDLGLEENDALNIIKAGDMLILTQKRLKGDGVAKEMEKAMKKKKITLQDLLKDLEGQRVRYNREVYGAKSKA
ncbi:MAG TPA: AbrB/MazE/SpoVT family DNA-binding domain-containing protein [Euryarchaeota archaeon]|nr:hypothetical protein BMS3Abin08_00285 [bacterium BMS3Abin08]HDL16014.1 AbrB/MazE/SpoVT family DNA-binding domain-containing protein [Euryarchaeota archaeon]HDZ61622.1 AbrB/MazE/SpoVT family DNA-binding domain-containing protein [Nitrospirota bacterium]